MRFLRKALFEIILQFALRCRSSLLDDRLEAGEALYLVGSHARCDGRHSQYDILTH